MSEKISEATSDSDAASASKRAFGQFFTQTNPFDIDPFRDWAQSIPNFAQEEFLEPFAGANNIVAMIQDLGYSNPWKCYDIEPVNDPARNRSGVRVEQLDTLANFPATHRVAITNPPYLAKNSASRNKLPYPKGAEPFEDLYQFALDETLKNVPYVAAIIPESFITQGLFHDRLMSAVSLPVVMFADTECPVCLALFVPASAKADANFDIYSESTKLGDYASLAGIFMPAPQARIPWKSNVPAGSLGLISVDSTKGRTIKFCPGSDIASEKIKISSRAFTRFSGLPEDIALVDLIEEANAILDARRDATHDVCMTSFKGLREDGGYRRRLSFEQAKNILDCAVESLRKKTKKAPKRSA